MLMQSTLIQLSRKVNTGSVNTGSDNGLLTAHNHYSSQSWFIINEGG